MFAETSRELIIIIDRGEGIESADSSRLLNELRECGKKIFVRETMDFVRLLAL
jgi:hypothetical protein